MTTRQPEVLDATLVDIADLIASGGCSSVEVTEAALVRARVQQPRLNCFIRLDEQRALDQARAADLARAAGSALGPLHGVPLAHKDMYYEAGQVTNCASRVRRGFIPTTTSTLLKRINDAGAINLGTLIMTEFALGPTGHNAIWGDCRNPWNLAHITCGSSSGSGAAVAARIVYGSLGSDTGGSTRLPAAANGVVGIKPTYSRLSRANCMGLSFSTDTPGPLARTARDCARIFGVVAGHDVMDPTSSRHSVPDYEAATHLGIEGIRIGVPENYFFDHVAVDVAKALQEALSTLEVLGAKLIRIQVPDPAPLAELSRAVVYSEASTIHGEWLRERGEDYSPQVRVRASTGTMIPASVYLEALHLRPKLLYEFVDSVFRRCDVLFTPALSIPVPTLADTAIGDGASMWQVISILVHCTAPFNYLGLPAISVPAGFTDNGLPASLQIVGRPFAEAQLFRVASAYQNGTDWHVRAPPNN
jgi:aspartyl-tRNA(Asn)/glutamyl-tRNA(Gln) amidotransferase subunit A